MNVSGSIDFKRYGMARKQHAAITLYKHSSSVEFKEFVTSGPFSTLKQSELRHYGCLQKALTVLVRRTPLVCHTVPLMSMVAECMSLAHEIHYTLFLCFIILMWCCPYCLATCVHMLWSTSSKWIILLWWHKGSAQSNLKLKRRWSCNRP